MSESTGGTGFAERLRELKDRSGHSYGMLAKRLHMSTSTLHRYCNGEAVPTDYAPVERMARLCGASPEELVALHRSWVLADAGRGKKAAEGVAPGAVGEVVGEAVTGEASASPSAPASATAPGPASGPAPEPASAAAPDPAPVPEPTPDADLEPHPASTPAPEAAVPGSRSRTSLRAGGRPRTGARSRRPVLIAAVTGAAVLGAVALAFGLPDSGRPEQGAAPAGATAAAQDRAPATGTASRGSGSPSPSGSSRHPSPSADRGSSAGPDAATSGPAGGATADDKESTAVPLAITTHPYSWESPCSQHYLIDRPPTAVSPPPVENDAPAWVAVHQAVSAGEQFVTLTVQGSGKQTVVLEGMSVRMAGKRAPLAWNDYAMGYPGVGCGGGVPTHSFTVALDAVRPAVQPVAGQRGFPLSVSESDPEVFYVTANASAYDVSWYLELSWSSGGRHGTLEIGDKGRPFRTSGSNGRPAYAFPLGGEKWAPAQ
ncbi:XRE family transcriptional regulator [Streptomyces griseofuscus]|uniref:XRE family transcriptional regulator n=1 Tax=Streptomyces griseofuscus TaxID=146922 RepID=A0A7H1Q0C7_9ACTN|nr:helix-turn-helix transcriptional regulator [Streptomyces griseofuscus]QNT93757.1 XRE family transcriptional regulator [Streptomyces griseofuscus]